MQEFIIGFLTSIIVVGILNKARKRVRLKKIGFRQSILRSITKDIMPTNAELRKKIKSQSKIYSSRQSVRVIQTPDNKAYWIEKNIFYCAEIVDGQFDPTMGTPVDTSNMSQKQVKELMFILDNLHKG
jgi:5-bromo-4-chloroindolyl phosphate hydrolysis protein